VSSEASASIFKNSGVQSVPEKVPLHGKISHARVAYYHLYFDKMARRDDEQMRSKSSIAR
jgi:hypothetical protein